MMHHDDYFWGDDDNFFRPFFIEMIDTMPLNENLYSKEYM
jgi:hypothetical protein